MPTRKRGHRLERWEVALVKAMLQRGGYNDQDILAYFTRPTRSINHRVIAEIRTEEKYKAVNATSQDDLDAFLATWPEVDPETGLSLKGDELLIKAREAMIAAVHIFNGAGLTFRAELFIVTCIISWTYLLHAWFKREGIDYRYKKTDGTVLKTREGADRYWDLAKCLRHSRCPVERGVVQNLEFLMELRHEIEHRSTSRLDDAISAKLQACCINFNVAIKSLFGPQYGLERRLPIALQFVTYGSDQRALLKKASGLPRHIETMMDAYHERMTPEEQADPHFANRVAFVPKLAGKASSSDEAVEFVRADSELAREINREFDRVMVKEVAKRRYSPTQVVRKMQREGYRKFRLPDHTALWQSLGAKDPAKGYGQPGVHKGTWEWFDKWIERVRQHCRDHAERYQ